MHWPVFSPLQAVWVYPSTLLRWAWHKVPSRDVFLAITLIAFWFAAPLPSWLNDIRKQSAALIVGLLMLNQTLAPFFAETWASVRTLSVTIISTTSRSAFSITERHVWLVLATIGVLTLLILSWQMASGPIRAWTNTLHK